MKPPRSRLRRHLSYANVMASIAVFVALGGISYAATTINGGKIINGTVGAKKLKNGTLTSKQVKKNSLNGEAIDESSLGMVPTAQTATTAGSASTAGSANTANSATNANHALAADTATKATTAGSADSALTAEDAETLDGLTSKQLQVTCPLETELFGGMCWDLDPRPAKNWIAASRDCGDSGGRLPSLSELIAYVFQPETQVTGQNWTGDLVDVESGKEIVATSDELSTEKALPRRPASVTAASSTASTDAAPVV
jgi:hypothetical protein